MYLFEKNKYLSFAETQYKINDDEIVIPESMITNDYFEGMSEFKRNEYIHSNTYDTAQPILSAHYSERITLDNCVTRSKPISVSKLLLRIYPSTYSVIEYGVASKNNRTPICSFELVITILNNEGINVTKDDLKNLLIAEYNKYPESDIVKKLSEESKLLMLRPVKGGMRSLEHVIASDFYYLTFLDIWMIATVYNLPIVFMGQYKMVVNDGKTFATEKITTSKKYYQILNYKPEPNIIPRYKLVVNSSNEIKFEISPFSLKKRFVHAFPMSKIIKISEFIKK